MPLRLLGSGSSLQMQAARGRFWRTRSISPRPILRQCPICLRDSIIGHGRRRKQAHDEDQYRNRGGSARRIDLAQDTKRAGPRFSLEAKSQLEKNIAFGC
jgi:hypothetical protein